MYYIRTLISLFSVYLVLVALACGVGSVDRCHAPVAAAAADDASAMTLIQTPSKKFILVQVKVRKEYSY